MAHGERRCCRTSAAVAPNNVGGRKCELASLGHRRAPPPKPFEHMLDKVPGGMYWGRLVGRLVLRRHPLTCSLTHVRPHRSCGICARSKVVSAPPRRHCANVSTAQSWHKLPSEALAVRDGLDAHESHPAAYAFAHQRDSARREERDTERDRQTRASLNIDAPR